MFSLRVNHHFSCCNLTVK